MVFQASLAEFHLRSRFLWGMEFGGCITLQTFIAYMAYTTYTTYVTYITYSTYITTFTYITYVYIRLHTPQNGLTWPHSHIPTYPHTYLPLDVLCTILTVHDPTCLLLYMLVYALLSLPVSSLSFKYCLRATGVQGKDRLRTWP